MSTISQIKREVKEDIIKIEEALSKSDEKILHDVHMMIDGKYQTKIERWGLSQYGWRDSYGFHYGTLDCDSLKHNLQNMKSKLEGYIQDIDLKPLTFNKPTKSINVYNKNENNISNIVSNVNFNTVEEKN